MPVDLILYALVGLMILAFLAFVFGASRSAGKYDRESERLAEADIEAAIEGALIAELSDIEFSSPARRISG
jgi:hypothetical protein